MTFNFQSAQVARASTAKTVCNIALLHARWSYLLYPTIQLKLVTFLMGTFPKFRHFLILKAPLISSSKSILQESHWPVHQVDCSKTISYLTNSSKYMLKNVIMPVKKDVLKEIKHRNALETIENRGWPRTYYTNEELCPTCNGELTSEQRRRQKTKEDESYLLTRDHCIPVTILSKKCKSCFLFIQAETLSFGLLNVGDTMLLSLELMYSMQCLVR